MVVVRAHNQSWEAELWLLPACLGVKPRTNYAGYVLQTEITGVTFSLETPGGSIFIFPMKNI